MMRAFQHFRQHAPKAVFHRLPAGKCVARCICLDQYAKTYQTISLDADVDNTNTTYMHEFEEIFPHIGNVDKDVV